MALLTESTWWQLTIFVIVLGLTIIAIIRAVSRRKVGVKIGKFQVGASDTDDSDGDVPASTGGHRDCVKHRDIFLIMQLSIESAKKTFEIERIDVIAQQMSYTEQGLSDLRSLFRKVFLKVLRESKGLTKPDGLLATHEARDYENILRILTFELKDSIRRVYVENHLTEMSEVEFEDYVSRRVRHLDEITTEILNEAHPPDTMPSRERVYDENLKVSKKIEDIFESMIRRGRIIAMEHKEKVAEIEADYNARIEEIVG